MSSADIGLEVYKEVIEIADRFKEKLTPAEFAAGVALSVESLLHHCELSTQEKMAFFEMIIKTAEKMRG